MARKKKGPAAPVRWEDVPEIPRAVQPYPLPDGWKWVKATDVFSIVYGKGLPTKKLLSEGYPVFGANGQIGFYNEYMYEGRQALMSCRGAYSGVMNLSSPYSFITNNSLVITGKNFNIDPEFIYFLFESLDKSTLISGSAQPQVTIQSFDNFILPFPPLDKHGLIVKRVKSLFSKLDEAAEKVQTVIDSHEARKQAILHHAFSGELTKKWRGENGVSLDSWTQETLGDYASVQYGFTEKASSEKVGPKFLRITDIQEGAVDWSFVPYCKISEENYLTYKLNQGDIVIARTGATTGKSYLIQDETEAVFASYLIRVVVRKPHILNEKFLYLFFQSSSYWEQIEDLSSGIAQPGVNGSKLKTLILPIPSIKEQRKILSLLSPVLQQVEKTSCLAELIRDEIDLVKKSLLNKAFRGELA